VSSSCIILKMCVIARLIRRGPYLSNRSEVLKSGLNAIPGH
jgi:hypothetical protein